MPTEPTDLLTVLEVQATAQGASDDVTDNPDEVVESAIRDVQGMVESYLDMPLLAHKRTERLERHNWTRDQTAGGQEWLAWADHQPIIEVVSPEGVGQLAGRRFVNGRPEACRIRYFAGYRRSDQTSGEQQGRFTDLNTEPQQLPSDIRRAAMELVIFVIERAGQVPGIRDREITFGGGQQIRTSGVDTGFVGRVLSRLDNYKVML